MLPQTWQITEFEVDDFNFVLFRNLEHLFRIHSGTSVRCEPYLLVRHIIIASTP